MRTLSSALALCLLLLGCGHDRPLVRVATDGSVFDRGGTGIVPEVSVPFTVVNRGDETLFLPACGGRPVVSVEQGVANHWEQYSGMGCIATVPQAPIELRSGQRVTSSWVFHESGHYRIRVPYGSSTASTFGGDAATSNAFDVR